MDKITSLKTKITTLAMLFCTTVAWGQFSNDNLAVLEAAASANNTTVSVVEINKTTAGQSAIYTIEIDGTGENAVRVSGSAATTLYAANSNDGTLFCFTGHKSEVTSENANTLLTRVVVTVGNNRTVTQQTTYTGVSGQQTRGVTSLDNTNFYIADQEGLYTNSAVSSDPSGNLKGIKAFGGTVYIGRASSGSVDVSTVSALTGGSITPLPGFTERNSNHQDFYLISSGTTGANFDVLYVLSASGDDAGTIAKYSLVNNTWVANGTYTTDFGGARLAAEPSGTGANLYVTTGEGSLVNNSVIKLVDAAGHNTDINITTENNVTLYTATGGAILKGIAFTPKGGTNSVEKTQLKNNWSIAGRTLFFETLPSSKIDIYSLTGSKTAAYEPANKIELNLRAGVYILKVDGKSAKIVLK